MKKKKSRAVPGKNGTNGNPPPLMELTYMMQDLSSGYENFYLLGYNAV
jgi:hypothetical protein